VDTVDNSGIGELFQELKTQMQDKSKMLTKLMINLKSQITAIQEATRSPFLSLTDIQKVAQHCLSSTQSKNDSQDLWKNLSGKCSRCSLFYFFIFLTFFLSSPCFSPSFSWLSYDH
jgi:hypothetical protein